MTTLMQASQQWATRPDDERFTSLIDMRDHFIAERDRSREVVVPSRRIHANPTLDNKGLEIVGPNGHPYNPTHWSFGQVAALAEAPAGYLRTLPSPIAADCINYGLQFKRSIEDVGCLLYNNGDPILRAATGPRYGRIWNSDVTTALCKRFGDGVTSQWKVPGEFGKAVTVTKANTTLFAGDRDMFIFLADEENRIEVPNRRNGEAGTMARGFFLWNSEVGSATFGVGTFLFDYVCCNRIVWGAEAYREIRIRHSVSAPDKWLSEVTPALQAYKDGSASNVVQAITDARNHRLEGDEMQTFLAERFGRRMVLPIQKAFESDEGRKMTSRWDVVTGVTAYARGITHQDERVTLERSAGELLELAA